MTDKERIMEDAAEAAAVTITPAHLLLISILTDKIITAVTTINQVGGMTDEEVRLRIKEEEELSNLLLGEIKEG